ncbi:hypothetical protein YQE_03322, partial [Dendroctonus ponderosae]
MYQLLPLVSVFSAVFSTLPVEMWCLILRLLDSSSLLAATRSSPLFERVVEGDPILKKTVQKAKRDEEQEIMERLTRPGMAASISRDEHAMLFGTNRQKIVTIAKSKYSLRQVKSYHKKKESSRCKARTTTTNTARFNPYRI